MKVASAALEELSIQVIKKKNHVVYVCNLKFKRKYTRHVRSLSNLSLGFIHASMLVAHEDP